MNATLTSPSWSLHRRWLASGLAAMLLAACGEGDGSSESESGSTAITAPTITTQPASAQVTAPRTATFTVVATGNAPLTYQWRKNGNAIDGANSASYTTPATTLSDNGVAFTVVVSNSVDSVTSQSAALTVQTSGDSNVGVTAVATDYVLAGLVDVHANGSTSQHHYVLYLVDPSHPETTRIVDDFGENEPQVLYADAYQIDSTARTALYRGAAQALYVKNRRIWAIDLVAGLDHSPRQVSSASVCGLKFFGNGYIFPTDSSAQVVWMEIVDCNDTGTLTTRTFAKSSMTPSEAAVSIAAPVAINSLFVTLADKEGRLIGGIAQGAGHFDFYDRNFVKQSVVEGSAGLNLAKLSGGAEDYSADKASYLTIDQTIYHLTWTSNSAQLSVSGDPDAGTPALADANAIYFLRGQAIFKKVGDSPASPLATLTGPRIAVLFMTNDRIIAQQSDGTGNSHSLILTSIDKTGLTPPVILAPTNGIAFGTSSDSVLLSVGAAKSLVKADGSGETALGAVRGIVYDPLQRNNEPWITATWTCELTSTPATSCSNGTIKETLLDGTSVILGQVAHGVDYRFAVFGSPTRLDSSSVSALGLPELITFYSAELAQTDLYLWRHGQANSLIRLTQNIP